MAPASPTQRLVKHAGILLTGGAAGAVFAFLTGVVSARYLGAGGLGTIALVQSVVLSVFKLVSFQSWRTVIKYGAEARERGAGAAERSEVGLKEVIKFGVLLDLVSAACASVLAVGACFVAARHFGWDAPTRLAGIAYAGSLLCAVTGAATGVLRMFDRFSVFVWQRLAAGPVRLAGVSAAWLLDLGPLGVLAAWIASDMTANLVVLAFGWVELRRRGLADFWRAPLAGVRSRHPGMLRFSLIMNLSVAIRTSWRDVDNLVIGSFLSNEAVGLYRVAKQFAQVLAAAQDPLQQAGYPDMARHAARGERRAFVHNLVAGTRVGSALAVAYLLALAIAGGLMIRLTVGPEFAGAAPVMLWTTAGFAVSLACLVLPNAAMALGRPAANLWSIAVATAVYVPLLFVLLPRAGLEGAGIASLVLYTVWCVALAIPVLRTLGAWREGAPVERRAGVGAD